jgi:hypothetical protein
MEAPQPISNARLRSVRIVWAKACPVLCLFALLLIFPGMAVVQFGLELATGTISPFPSIRMPGLFIAALACIFLLGLALFFEFAAPPLVNTAVQKLELPPKYRAWESIDRPGAITLIEVLIFQGIVLLLYALMLDGGVSLRGALYSWLCYLVGVAVVFVRRGLAVTKGDLLWIKWAWLPFITFGVPLYVSASRGKWPVPLIRSLIDSING